MKKAFTKVSTSILVILLTVMMLFNVATDAVGGSVEAAGYIKKLTSVDTNYKSFVNGDVAFELPSTVKDDDIISIIVMLNTPSLLETYNERGQLTFTQYVFSEEANRLRENVRADMNKISAKLTSLGIKHSTGAEYGTVLTGYELLIEAKDFKDLCEVLGDTRQAVVGEVYKPAETQLVENNVNVYDTGIFDSSAFGYDGEGIVVAVLDTGLDYTHDAFKPENLAGKKLGLTFSEVEALLGGTNAKEILPGLLASDVYVSDKVPFAFDYADYDSDVYSIHNNHGTHVSGVIAGDDDVITGVAPKAQIVSMKIFSDTYDSAYASWILSALEDAVALGVDVINMSLGTACGFSRVSDKEAMSGVYDRIREKGISLVVAASNSYSSAYGSEKNGNLGLTSNPDTGTVGSPSTYEAALSIASINGTKTPYILYGNKIMYFVEATDAASEEKNFFNELLDEGETSRDFEYVLIPGVGRHADYNDIDVTGKIVLVKRGTTTFEQKANEAKKAGAAGIIIYNNTSGEIKMNAGNIDIPICSISQDDGEVLAAAKSGVLKISRNQTSGPFMSDFSSWGPTPDLRIKPEITAHGGNILSAVTGNEYDRLSGTSMACPNMAGVIAVLRQYVIENYPVKSEITYTNGEINYPEVNAIINRILMSTADIVYAKNGLPYAVRKQGAGLANLTASGNTTAFILTYDKDETVFSRETAMDKTKIELGDDPTKSGEYTFTFSVYNFGNSALSYNISALVMTEGVSDTPTYKGETVVTEEGYILGGASVKINGVVGGQLDGTKLTVGAGATADVSVTIKLSDEDKKYLDESFENGMYVEGFVKLTAVDGTDVSMNAPFLAFYGDWTQAPLFDIDYFETNKDELNDAIATLDKTLPDAYATRPIGGIESDYISYLGSYFFLQNPNDKIIAASRDYIALSNYEGTVHSLRFVWAGLLRNAAKIEITITDAQTGEVIFTRTETDVRKSYGDGGSIYPANVEIEFDTQEYNLKNNTQYNVKLQGYVDYGDGGLTANESTTFEFPFTTDFEAPAITGVEYYTEYDKDQKKNRLFARVAIYDNHYTMSMQVGYIAKAPDNSEYENQIISFSDYLTPVYSDKNSTTYVTYELTDYIYDIKNKGVNKNTLAISVYDYAMNIGVYEIPLPAAYTDFYLEETAITLNPYELYTLTPLVYPGTEWPELLTYTSTNENVIRIVNNKVVAVGSGKALVLIHNENDDDPNHVVKLGVTVRGPGDEGYREVKPASIADDFNIIGYNTLKAYYRMASADQDIGETGNVRSFSGSPSLSMFPSESVELRLQLDAYFPNMTVTYKSGNEKVVSVDENGVITANEKGSASIDVVLSLLHPTEKDKNGNPKVITKTSKSVRVEVKDPYIRSGPSLTNYFGNGGLVQIPADLKLTEIGQYAFSNYMYIDKDPSEITEDEPDATKPTYIGDDTITKVIIPEGVEKIGAYAFANLTALESVELPSTLKYIEYGAFYGCTSLKTVKGLENVVTINKYAFMGCDLKGHLSLDSAHAIADYAFASLTIYYTDANGNVKYSTYANDFTEVTISATLRSIGASAFKGANALESVNIKAEKIKLGAYAFYGCTSLKEIEINASVVPTGAFQGCRNLTSIKLGKDVAAIGEFAFNGTKAAVTIDENNPYIYSTEDGKAILKESSGLTTLVMVTPAASGAFTLEGVHIIGQGAFAGSTKITAVEMPDAVMVEDYAFADCTMLSSVSLGKLVSIGDYAFFNTPLKVLPTFDENLYSIGAYAFAYTDLTSVTIPAGMTVGEGAFCECQKLESVYIGDGAVLGKGAFMLGRNSQSYRGGASNYKLVSKTVDGQKIYYFKYLSSLTTIEIGKNVVIGESAFQGAASVISVTLGEGADIGKMAFYNAETLAYIDLSKAKFIGEMAFSGDVLYQYTDPNQNEAYYDEVTGDYIYSYHAPKFTSVDLSSATLVEKDAHGNVIREGKQAFQYCDKLTTVVLGDNAIEIPYGAFADCNLLTTVNLGKVESVGEMAFSNTALATLDLSSATEIDKYAFVYCEKLTAVTFKADGGVSIGEGAFAYCDKLTDTVNLSSVNHIGAYAFAYSAITKLDLSGAVTIGDLAFMKPSRSDYLYDGTVYVLEVTLGESLMSLGDNPFANSVLAPFSKVVTSKWNNVEYSETVYTFDISEGVKVIDGSLYSVVPYGLELSTYVPNGNLKAVVIPEGVVRITAMAFSNTDVVMVTLPHSLNSIGHKAFYDCSKLTTVVFKSYYAPVLEEEFDQNYFFSGENFPDKSEYQAGDETFKGLEIVPYIMYITLDGTTETFDYSTVYYGANFVDYVGHRDPSLVMVYPSNGIYYDSFILDRYFSTKVEGAVSADENTLLAIEAIAKLPAMVMLEDEALVIAARQAYDKVLLEQRALVTNYSKLLSAENDILLLKSSNSGDGENDNDNSTPDAPAAEEKDNTVLIILIICISVCTVVIIGAGVAIYLVYFKGKKLPGSKADKNGEKSDSTDASNPKKDGHEETDNE